MIVFPMAGLSRRYTEAGYSVAKFMLPLWNGYVLDFAIASFEAFFRNSPFLFIYRETGGVRDFIEARTSLLGISDLRFAELKAVTAGQAETVEFGLDVAAVSDDTQLTIFNIDTFRRPGRSFSSLSRGQSGCLEVFRGGGENWSFVRPHAGTERLVAETAEKVAISDLCSDGLYHFTSAAMFRRALAAERVSPSAGELYIAPIYNHLIAQGYPVVYEEIDIKDLVFCGVPSEYEALSRLHAPWPTLCRAER